MDDKENSCKGALKRKSVMCFSNEIQAKRQLTDSISDNDISMSSVDLCNTPEVMNNNHYSSCLTGTFNAVITLDNSYILNEQNVSNDDSLNLSELESLTSIEHHKESRLERSLTEILAPASPLNDSFEILKSRLTRFNTCTPITFATNNTPETPCDLHDIDLEKMGSIRSLRENIQNIGEQPQFARQSSRAKLVQISPICYEAELKLKNTLPKTVKTIKKPITMTAADVLMEDENRIREISADLVHKVISNDYTSKFYVYHIIDCRYPYEYDGGHIKGAVNLYTPYQLLNYTFMSTYNMDTIRQPLDNPEQALSKLIDQICTFERPPSKSKTIAYIFHCEFSSVRGPELARCLRNMDRAANLSKYPKLYFPKVYIMTKGYKEFYSQFKDCCDPINYVRMDIVGHNREMSDCIAGESDDEDILTNDPSFADLETVKQRLKMYNACKREAQEQMQLFSQLISKVHLKEDN